ncbi:hypothetical protein [Deinococcus sp. Marseille-Q6407]|uniref:hypothetical protein n=1 Tax=Deinococcus sp. Marseille-Q6407 TaxID=2969223 RepID=UPI0021C006C4|nr:hypothetical protein [Deinococcus sp. Marseille-Q6407]
MTSPSTVNKNGQPVPPAPQTEAPATQAFRLSPELRRAVLLTCLTLVGLLGEYLLKLPALM